MAFETYDEKRPLFHDALEEDQRRQSMVPADFEAKSSPGCFRRRCCTHKALAILSLSLGAVLLAVGFAAKPAVDAIMKDVIAKDAVMDSSSSLFFDTWQSSEKVPIYMTFYIFNITNADDMRSKGAFPKYDIVGPYNYAEQRVKHNYSWSEDKTTIRYRYNRTFHLLKTPCPKGVLYPDFECTLNDTVNVTTPNIALMGFINTFSNIFSKEKKREAALNNLNVWLQKNAGPEGKSPTHAGDGFEMPHPPG